MVHPEHLIAVLSLDESRKMQSLSLIGLKPEPLPPPPVRLLPHLFLGLLHQGVLVSTRVQLSQQVSVDEVLRLRSREEVT